MDLVTQPKMVGREEEFNKLKTFLDEAREGHGNMVFIAGEAGVGKTRLVEELKVYAKEQGVDVLQGGSLYESLTPYMPFLEALRSGGLESLFADETPRVEAVYLLTHSGLSVKEVIREETKLDPDIFSGMLTAVGNFVEDSLSLLSGEQEEGSLNTLGYKNYRILIESLGNMNLVVILTGLENEFLVNDMKEVLVNVDKQYGSVLKEWDGEEKGVLGIEKLIEMLITSGKYDGIDYAKDNPQIKRNRLFENILLGIERHTKVNPSILCIEDMQWADPSSMALMHYVARNTRKCNLLILGTYRPEDVCTTKDGEVHHLINAMQMMSHEDLLQKIDLERLNEKYMGEMLASFFEQANFADDFKALLYKETEGNPFFIISLIRMMVEEGTIKSKDDMWILSKDVKEANIPSKIYDVIIRRLFRVKEKDREILEFAAVIGEEFPSDILSKVTQINKIELLKQLRTLEQSHKLIRSIDKKYKFDHAKIKEVLYQHIPSELRMEYHGIIADNIKELNKDNLENAFEDIAYHYYRSVNNKNAKPFLIKAAEKAKKYYSNEEAIRFYKKAMELEENTKQRMAILEELGDIYRYSADYEKAIDFYKKGLELCDNIHKKGEIMAKIGWVYERKGDYSEVLRNSYEVLEIVEDEDCLGKAFAFTNLGIAYTRLGDYIKGLDFLKKGLEIGKRIDDLRQISRSLVAIGIIHDYKAEYEEAIESYTKAIECNRKTGNMLGIGTDTSNIGITYRQMGEYNKAHIFLERALTNHKMTGDKGGIMYTYLGLADLHYKEGDLNKAYNYVNKAYELSMNIGNKSIMAGSYMTLGLIYGKQEKWKESLENYKLGSNIYNKIDLQIRLAYYNYEFGLMWKEKGDIDKAKENFQKALDIFQKLNIHKQAEKVKKELQSCQ